MHKVLAVMDLENFNHVRKIFYIKMKGTKLYVSDCRGTITKYSKIYYKY